MHFRTGNSGLFLAPKSLWTEPPLLRLMACGRLPGCLNFGCMQSKDGAGTYGPKQVQAADSGKQRTDRH